MLQWLDYRLLIFLCCFCNEKAKVLENTVLKDRTLSTAESDSPLSCLTQPPYPQPLSIRRISSPPTTKPWRHQRPGFKIPDCHMYQVGVSPKSGRGCTSTELGTDMSITGSVSSVGFTNGREWNVQTTKPNEISPTAEFHERYHLLWERRASTSGWGRLGGGILKPALVNLSRTVSRHERACKSVQCPLNVRIFWQTNKQTYMSVF